MAAEEIISLDRNLALDAVRVTEAAARAAARLIGRGDEMAADQAAVDAMRRGLNALDIAGTVVIGEGERDEAPMLYIGENVGTGKGPSLDVALDPLEGTTICATGGPNALAVLAMAEKGGFLAAPDTYMDKIAVGDGLPDELVDLDDPPATTLAKLAKAKACDVNELTVLILDRPRHEELIAKVRETQAPHPVDPGWRRRRRDRDHPAQPHRRHLHWDRRRARGRAGRRRAPLHRRPDDGPARLPQRRREEGAPARWASPTWAASTPCTSSRAATLCSARPGSPTAPCCAASRVSPTARGPARWSCAPRPAPCA